MNSKLLLQVFRMELIRRKDVDYLSANDRTLRDDRPNFPFSMVAMKQIVLVVVPGTTTREATTTGDHYLY